MCGFNQLPAAIACMDAQGTHAEHGESLLGFLAQEDAKRSRPRSATLPPGPAMHCRGGVACQARRRQPRPAAPGTREPKVLGHATEHSLPNCGWTAGHLGGLRFRLGNSWVAAPDPDSQCLLHVHPAPSECDPRCHRTIGGGNRFSLLLFRRPEMQTIAIVLAIAKAFAEEQGTRFSSL